MNILFDETGWADFTPSAEALSYEGWNLQIHNEDSSVLQLHEYFVPFCFTVEECKVSEDRLAVSQYSPRAVVKGLNKLSDFPNYAHRPLHQHNGFELMLVLSGTVHHRVESHRRPAALSSY